MLPGLVGLLILSPPATAQTPVSAPGGMLRGVVQDSATGLPVSYALVVWLEKDQRLFATESGRFAVSGLPSGIATLRVQQIGYRAVTLSLAVDARAAVTGPVSFVVTIARQPVVLPTIVVQGSVCAGAEALAMDADGGSILDEAFRNAERLLTLQKSYPFRGAFQRATTIFDTAYNRVTGWVDTVRYDSRSTVAYRRGKVLEGPAGPYWWERRDRRELANYFTAADLANPEFRTSHCFWYAGPDSLQGFQGYRIQFAPTTGTRGVDWAGSLLIDATTMTLLQSTARLVNLPRRGTVFGGAECTVLYKQLAPTLAHEFQARCVSTQRTDPPQTVVELWLLSEFTFIGRSPVEPPPP